jgi:gamma-glutamyl-gamma-aminobutyrate hydrolase PuuD
MNHQPVHPQRMNSQPGNSQPGNSQPISRQPVNRQPITRPPVTRQPTILIATSFRKDQDNASAEAFIRNDYVRAVAKAGGVPILVPPMVGGQAWIDLVTLGDGALLVGGLDLDPASYGQEKHPKTEIASHFRQEADLRLLTWVKRTHRPVMGICLGAQVLNVFRGGTLVQHVPDRFGDAVQHQSEPGQPRPRHDVRIEPESRLAEIVGATTLSVNSGHHQALDAIGQHLRPVAWSADGVVEAVEDDRRSRFALGLQWHPEELCHEPPNLALFEALVKAARIVHRNAR